LIGTGLIVFRRAVKIVQARMGIVSNNEKLVTEPRYFEGQVMESLLTNIHSIEPIPYTDDLDAYFIVIDDPNVHPQVTVTERVLFTTGDFSRYEKECSDNRYSLFGNMGLYFKYLLVTLERYHCIYSFHASSMFRYLQLSCQLDVQPLSEHPALGGGRPRSRKDRFPSQGT
jgi:hypothetical protein